MNVAVFGAGWLQSDCLIRPRVLLQMYAFQVKWLISAGGDSMQDIAKRCLFKFLSLPMFDLICRKKRQGVDHRVELEGTKIMCCVIGRPIGVEMGL